MRQPSKDPRPPVELVNRSPQLQYIQITGDPIPPKSTNVLTNFSTSFTPSSRPSPLYHGPNPSLPTNSTEPVVSTSWQYVSLYFNFKRKVLRIGESPVVKVHPVQRVISCDASVALRTTGVPLCSVGTGVRRAGLWGQYVCGLPSVWGQNV